MKEKSSKKIVKSMSLLTTFLLLADQYTKRLASENLETPYEIIKNFFQLTYTENTGIAFSIDLPQWLLMGGTVFLVFCIIYFSRKELDMGRRLSQTCIAAILAGALSNFLDRIMHGHVIDFISIWKWPIFNLADVYITLGVLALLAFYGRIKKV